MGQVTAGTVSVPRNLPHDWTRKYFTHLPESAASQEHLEAPYLVRQTPLEVASRSREGLAGTVVVARNPDAGSGRRKIVLWHGRERLVEETFQGWFGARLQRVQSESFHLLLDRVGHFLVIDPSIDPTYVLPLSAFARLGVSHGVMEAILGARVLVAAEAPYARGAYVPSLRVYVDYDGTRYAHGTRKLFQGLGGAPVSVESVAREILGQMHYKVVPPALFRRMFLFLVERPPSQFRADAWPEAFLRGRLSPLEWVLRARERIEYARDVGLAKALHEAAEAYARRPYVARHMTAETLPFLGRHLSLESFESLLETLGQDRVLAILEGMLLGYEAANADWFGWQPGTSHAFLCEVKSRGDTLRDTQKESIIWCQRTGALDYRLLEVLHNAPSTTGEPNV